MALDDLGGVLKDLSGKVSFVPLPPEKEARARELVRESRVQIVLLDSPLGQTHSSDLDANPDALIFYAYRYSEEMGKAAEAALRPQGKPTKPR